MVPECGMAGSLGAGEDSSFHRVDVPDRIAPGTFNWKERESEVLAC